MPAEKTLNAVQRFLNEKVKEGCLDTYAVMSCFDGEKRTAFSPNADRDTLFDMASCGKVLVTAPLALQAVSGGKIQLSDTLPRFFDGVPETARNITVQQLLTHTSGIVRTEFPTEMMGQSRDAFIRRILNAGLAFAPGSDYRYSCNGMLLVGFLLENIYGKPLEVIFEENLKKPLGYKRSRFNVDFGEENTAVSYRWYGGGPYPYAHPWDDENIRILQTAAGSGGQFFTVSDIALYADAILDQDERLYDKELFTLAEQDHTPRFSEGRGLGWWTADSRFPEGTPLFSKGTFGHTGATGTSLFLNRSDHAYVIILTNMRRFSEAKYGSFEAYRSAFANLRREIHENIRADLF